MLYSYKSTKTDAELYVASGMADFTRAAGILFPEVDAATLEEWVQTYNTSGVMSEEEWIRTMSEEECRRS